MRLLQGHRWAVRAVAYPPGDPATLVSAGDDGLIRLWNTTSGEQWGALPGHRSGTLALAFSPSGAQLASGGRDGYVRLWDMAAQREVHVLRGSPGPVGLLAFAPDGRGVLAAQPALDLSVRTLVVWAPSAQVAERPIQFYPYDATVHALAFAPEGDVVAVADDRRLIIVWDYARRTEQWRVWGVHSLRHLAFAPPGAGRLLAAAAGALLEVWDVQAQELRAVCKGHRGRVHAVAFAPDGRTVLSGAADHTVRWWDVTSGRELASWDWKLGRVFTVVVSPDGTTAAAGGEKPGVVVWDLD